MAEALSSQLARALVAFTMEADDEFEHRVPHRTTEHGATGTGPKTEVPWLVSLLMWPTCLEHIPEEGITTREYSQAVWWQTRKGIATTLRRMGGWWGYLTVDKAASTVVPTAAGRRAIAAWREIPGEVEARWRERHGAGAMTELTAALTAVVEQFSAPLPPCLMIYDCDLERRAPERPQLEASLSGLLAQMIQRLEQDAAALDPLPLELSANVLAALGPEPLRVKDLVGLTGLTADGVEASLRRLRGHKLIEVGPDPGASRFRVATLTRAGARRQSAARERDNQLEQDWRHAYGDGKLSAVAEALAPIVGEAQDPEGPLWAGLYRYPDGWRSSLPRPRTLPHHPLVSHRGGYLDGA